MRFVLSVVVLVLCFTCCRQQQETVPDDTQTTARTPQAHPDLASLLGCYGYARNTSARIDALAHGGFLFTRSVSVSPWTNPSIASIFTGLYPRAIFPPSRHEEGMTIPLPLQMDTLAERLKEAGYRTIALVDHPRIAPRLRYDQGFDVFIQLFAKGKFPVYGTTDPAFVLKEVDSQIDQSRQRKFFLYLHLIYPHRPYAPPVPYDTMFGPGFKKISRSEKQGLINRYDGEIRQTDDLIGALFVKLKARNLLQDTYSVITSDHGEAFFEHGLSEHGNALYDEELRVPLILVPPGASGLAARRFDERVCGADLFSTILAMAGLKPRSKVDGENLPSGILKNNGASSPRLIFSENPHSGDIDAAACFFENCKYIWQPRYRRDRMLFDLSKDPEERENVAAQNLSRLNRMHEYLARHLDEMEAARARLPHERIEPDEEMRERLRALGYVDR